MIDIIKIHNFLNPDIFKKLKKDILDKTFIWHYNEDSVVKGDGFQQFNHVFYGVDYAPTPYSFNIIKPFVDKLDPFCILRIKINLQMKTSKNMEAGYHIDYNGLENSNESKTAIFYINTNNGYTKFENGLKIESTENTLVIFPTKVRHTGATCTDENRRLVLNCVYF